MANRTATKEAAGPKSLKRLEGNKGGREERGKNEKKRSRRWKMKGKKWKMGLTFPQFFQNG